MSDRSLRLLGGSRPPSRLACACALSARRPERRAASLWLPSVGRLSQCSGLLCQTGLATPTWG
eukprot:5111082-Pyramimonas_sp.AAC.1